MLIYVNINCILMEGCEKMTLTQIILGSVVLVLSAVTIFCIAIQKGNSGGLGAITGGADMDTFFGKNKNRSKESMLTIITIVLAIVLVVCIIALDFFGIAGK